MFLGFPGSNATLATATQTASPQQYADELRQAVIELCTNSSMETTPGTALKVLDYRAHLAPATRVYVTYLPDSDFGDTCATCIRLAGEGFRPIPHIAARNISDAGALGAHLQQLQQHTSIDEALVIAGGGRVAAGPFANSMQLVNSGILQDCGITRFGFAGHPEGSPDISEFASTKALADKNDFAQRTGAECHLVTQFCFEAAPVIAWERMSRAQGNQLPVAVGLPGLATLKTLINHARACGVGPSVRFLTRQAPQVAKLLSVSAPSAQLLSLANARLRDPKCMIERVHMFPLGGLARSAAWMRALESGNFTAHRGAEQDVLDVFADSSNRYCAQADHSPPS